MTSIFSPPPALSAEQITKAYPDSYVGLTERRKKAVVGVVELDIAEQNIRQRVDINGQKGTFFIELKADNKISEPYTITVTTHDEKGILPLFSLDLTGFHLENFIHGSRKHTRSTLENGDRIDFFAVLTNRHGTPKKPRLDSCAQTGDLFLIRIDYLPAGFKGMEKIKDLKQEIKDRCKEILEWWQQHRKSNSFT